MMLDVFTRLLGNTFLILGLIFIFSLYYPYLKNLNPLQAKIWMGVSFGVFGILNMILTIEILPGVVVDVRNPFVLVGGFIGGVPGSIISGFLIAGYRYFVVGGAGALTGSSSILLNIPLAWWVYKRRDDLSIWHLLLVGAVSAALSVLTGYIFLPLETAVQFVSTFLPIALILYPFTTLVIILLIQREERRLKIDEALRQSEKRFRAIFNQATQFIGLLTPDGIMLEANDTALDFIGAQPTDVIGKPFWEAKWWSNSEENRMRLRAAIREAAQGNFVQYRVEIAGKDNQTLTINFSLKPITNQHGRVILLIPEGRDITNDILAEQQRIELAVERERAEITRNFIQESSHHLRTPLTILGTSSFLMRNTLNKLTTTLTQIASSPQRDEAMQFVERLTTRTTHFDNSLKDLTNVIQQLIQLNLLETMNGYHPEQVNLTQLILDEIARFEPIATEKQIKLQTIFPDTPIQVMVDNSNFRLVLQNLIENAFRYTHPQGDIKITVTSDDQNATIAIQDSGIGISETDQARIFTRFFRASNALDMQVKGTGLGLSIVRQIIEQEGGVISVTSQLGVGTTFSVMIPLEKTISDVSKADSTSEPTASIDD